MLGKIMIEEKQAECFLCVQIYRPIQSARSILKDIVGEVIWTENVNKVPSHSPPFRSYEFFLRLSRIYYCDCRILQNGNSPV
jgi:hypothetical protein